MKVFQFFGCEIKQLNQEEKKQILNSKTARKIAIVHGFEDDTYLLEDGQLLFDCGDHADLYPSPEDFKKAFEQIKNSTKSNPIHILQNRFGFDKFFPDKVDATIKEKIIEFKLGLPKRGFSLNYLYELQKEIEKKIVENINQIDAYFLFMVCVVGKCIIDYKKNARWVMKFWESAKIWHPFIMDEFDKIYDPAEIVYKSIYERLLEGESLQLMQLTKTKLKNPIKNWQEIGLE